MSNSLFNEGFEGRSFKVVDTCNVKDDQELINNIDRVVIKDNVYHDADRGDILIKNVIFFLKEGHSRSFKLSPLNKQFDAGTKINPKSVVLQKIQDEDTGDTYLNCTCEEL